MNPETKIEFYKNRTLGERFSAAIDFMKQNWKIMYKYILIVGIPAALLMGLGMQAYFQALEGLVEDDFSGFAPIMILYLLIAWIFSAILPATVGAIMIKYEKGELATAGFSDLLPTILSLMGKTLLLSIIFIFIFAITGFAMALPVAFGSMVGAIIMILLLLLLLAAIIALLPSFSIVLFPAYFKGTGIFASIKEAFRLGFKNWGSLFLTLLLVSLVLGVISTLFGAPLQILVIFNTLQDSFAISNFWTFLLGTLAAFGNVVVVPIMIVFFAFQYFSITEKEEGVSLKNRIDDFENL